MTRRRAQRLLGLTPAEAEQLLSRARRRLGRRAYAIRAAAFGLATAPLARRLVPTTLRRRAIRPFLYAILPGPSENNAYVAPAGVE